MGGVRGGGQEGQTVMGDSANVGRACPATLVTWGKALPAPQRRSYALPALPHLPERP